MINNWKNEIIRLRWIDDDVEIIVIELIVDDKKINNCLIVDVDFVLCLIIIIDDVFDNIKIIIIENW